MNMIELRGEINEIDSKIVTLIARRNEISQEIGKYKKEHNMDVFDPKREEALLNRLHDEAIKLKVDAALIEAIYAKILAQSRKLQE